jgi:hypothetical protein
MKKTDVIIIRVSPLEKREILDFSKKEKATMSEIIRDEIKKKINVANS